MAFFDFKIKNKIQLKKIFKKLSKIYHPDNKETGDKDIFIQIKKEYDEKLQSFNNVKIFYISIEQAFYGCEIVYNNKKIKIPPKYNYNKPLYDGDETIYVLIKQKKDCFIVKNNNENIIYKTIDINPFDIILGYKEIHFLDKKIILKTNKIEKYIFCPNCGFLKQDGRSRNGVYIKLKLKNIILNEEDKELIELMRSKYEN